MMHSLRLGKKLAWMMIFVGNSKDFRVRSFGLLIKAYCSEGDPWARHGKRDLKYYSCPGLVQDLGAKKYESPSRVGQALCLSDKPEQTPQSSMAGTGRTFVLTAH